MDRAALRQAYEDADIYFSTALMGILRASRRWRDEQLELPSSPGWSRSLTSVSTVWTDFSRRRRRRPRRLPGRDDLGYATAEKIARHNAENLPPQNWDTIAEATWRNTSGPLLSEEVTDSWMDRRTGRGLWVTCHEFCYLSG